MKISQLYNILKEIFFGGKIISAKSLANTGETHERLYLKQLPIQATDRENFTREFSYTSSRVAP